MGTSLKTDSQMTENGCLTHESSLDACVDFFFLAGASRGKDITGTFKKAFEEDEAIACRILQWTRDVRGGAGERQLFKDMLEYLANNHQAFGRRVLVKAPTIGRWDDILCLFGTPLESDALKMISSALRDGDGLCAKWMPRKGPAANKIRSYLQITPKEYRKKIVALSDTVEQKMCSKKFDEIEYGKLPSLASARYQQAFLRNDEKRYRNYINKVSAGEEKVNAGAVYPYDILKSVKHGNTALANEQWNSLPDYLAGSDENILPVIDVSGSMGCTASGSITCMEVAISLGLYVSERIHGNFKDSFITFSSNPSMEKVTGTLSNRFNTISRANWGMNTNIQEVFKLVLDAAVAFSLPESEMPNKIIIFSDMEFDRCTGSSGDITAMNMIRDKFSKAGYQVPQLIFWNLNGRSGNVPVTYHESGTALVSGFSPALMTSLLGDEDITPKGVMLKTVSNNRYDF